MLLFIGIIPCQLKPLVNDFDDDQVLDLVVDNEENDIITLDFFPVGQSTIFAFGYFRFDSYHSLK